MIAKLPNGTVVYDQTFNAAYSDATVQAAVTGDRQIALAALLANPLVRDYDVAEPLLEQLRDTLPVDNAPAEKGLFDKVKDYFG